MSKDFIQPESRGARARFGPKTKVAAAFLLLGVVLAAIYAPSFANPPRSDYWSTFYAFQEARTSPDGLALIVNYDPFRHGTHRPLFYVFLFIEHAVFGDWFIGNHLVSFLLYLTCIPLLYLAGRTVFGAGRAMATAFTLLFAGLFSHFDIITWTFHVASIIGLAAFLSGGILLARWFREPGRHHLLGAVGILFLLGMLCYEVFAAWPLAAAGVAWARSRKKGPRPPAAWPVFVTVLLIYVFYLGGFWLLRQSGTYMGNLRTPSLLAFLVSLAGPFFNLIYNSVCLNLVPIISVPALVADNVNLGGLLAELAKGLYIKILIVGGIAGAASGWALLRLHRRRPGGPAGKLAVLLFLYYTYFFIVMAARLTTNPVSYPFIQFRYQFVPNALAALGGMVLLTDLLRPRRREKIVICLAIVPILAANLYLSRTYSNVLTEQLLPLKTMLNNIRLGMEQGAISPERKLFINPGVTEKLPLLCWNRTMAYLGMVRGTYRWLFTGERQAALAERLEDAAWTIPAENPGIIRPTRPR